MPRKHICDVPGCDHTRARWQRLCNRCFKALPGDIRDAITRCWKLNYKPEHRAACKRAGEHMRLDQGEVPAPGHITPQDAYERQQRLLGEKS